MDASFDSLPVTPRSTNAVTALIHLHRAEVGRLTTYRVRLDTTTSWAVTSSALVTTFALGNPQIPHAALLFLGFIVFFFLQLEARRFRAYEASRHRVHLLERSFYREILGGRVDPRWTDQLLEALEQPGITVNRVGALGWRLRRNYLWIITAVMVAWVGKLYLSGESTIAPSDLVARAAIGGIPGGLIAGGVGLCYLALLAVAVGARRIYPLGDDEARQMMEQASEE
ncbi:MAG: DUF2270 domain-containing protein [Chloroflexi bacterium]|nr:DUF2270 domain-containing protein [Chloroflexota bacterium]